MTINKFNEICDHIWKYKEYLRLIEEFDYPFYGGLKSKMNGSPESVDAIQNIWFDFQLEKFKTKKQFKSAYKQELKRIGELIK
jgi:hypothetical protein